jgi:hypothetical protein
MTWSSVGSSAVSAPGLCVVAELGEPTAADGLDQGVVLAFHDRSDGVILDLLVDEIPVGGPARVEDLATGVDEAFNHRIRPTFVFGLDVVRRPVVLDIRVVTRQYHRPGSIQVDGFQATRSGGDGQ